MTLGELYDRCLPDEEQDAGAIKSVPSKLSPQEIAEIEQLLHQPETPENTRGEWLFEVCPLHGRERCAIEQCKVCNTDGEVKIWVPL